MVPLDLLQRESMFAFLHTLDVDLAEGTRAQGCPIVRARSTAVPTYGSLGAAPRISPRPSPSARACAAGGRAAGGRGSYRPRCFSGAAGSTEGLWSSSAPRSGNGASWGSPPAGCRPSSG